MNLTMEAPDRPKLQRRWSTGNLDSAVWFDEALQTFGDSAHRVSHSPSVVNGHFRHMQLFPGGENNSVFEQFLTTGNLPMDDVERRFMADYYDSSFFNALDNDYNAKDLNEDPAQKALRRCGVTTPHKDGQSHALAPTKLKSIKELLERVKLDNKGGKRPIEDLSILKDVKLSHETSAPLIPMLKALVQDVFQQIVDIIGDDSSEQGNDIREWSEKFETNDPNGESEFL